MALRTPSSCVNTPDSVSKYCDLQIKIKCCGLIRGRVGQTSSFHAPALSPLPLLSLPQPPGETADEIKADIVVMSAEAVHAKHVNIAA